MEPTEILRQIDSLKKEAEKLQPVKPEYERAFWDKFRLEFNYNSNHLEGNTLTYGHTQLLLLFDKVGGDYSLRELEEMKAHDVAMKIVKDAAIDPEHTLTEKFIKEINELILVRPFYKEAITPDGQPTKRLIEPGQYKKFPNSVRLENSEIFNYASPEETPALMGDLMDWYRKESESKELHPVHLAALYHYRFVRIHPFDDSNGRTARLLMNYILMKKGYAPIVIESADKKNYLTALNKADTGDINSFVNYISGFSLRWQELYTKALKEETIEEKEDLDKKIDVLKKSLSDENDIEVVKELSIIKDHTIKYFIPFLKFLDNQFAKLDQFFFEKQIFIRGSNLDRKYKNLNSIEQFSADFSNVLFHSSSLKVSFIHKGLKKTGKREWGYTSEVTIICKEFKYRIEFEGLSERIIKQYQEALTIEEYSPLVEKLIKKEVIEIEKKLSA